LFKKCGAPNIVFKQSFTISKLYLELDSNLKACPPKGTNPKLGLEMS
jgi:hypothetical protein